MFKHISKLMNHQPLKVTMLSLMLAITGIVGVSYTGETHQKLLSSTAQANTYHQIPTEELTENITTLSTKSRELNIKGKVQFPDQDGIYLYGQSAQPNQLGEGYILFQKQQNRIIGAL
ncbi:MAG: hypothetical protein ACKPE3_34990, partial [Sphaerospermopsis kisseleviana]